MTTTIDNTQDVINSCDIIARIQELLNTPENDLQVDDLDELDILQELAEEASDSSDWVHGVILIRDTYFQEYTREYARDIGAMNPHQNWPGNCIDWNIAAEQLQMNYTSVEFDGITYWIRA